MTKNHRYFLDLAFRIAENNLGKTKLNPSVGTVIVKNNTVIYEHKNGPYEGQKKDLIYLDNK